LRPQKFSVRDDPYSGESYEHRRQWIRDRLEFLAGIFGIDCLTFTIMSNHIHLVLRSRPDVVATWSDEEVARRWLRLFPPRREQDASPAEPTPAEIAAIVNQAHVLAQRRRRLSDVSWWMKCTTETIARRANREDRCTGHFWEEHSGAPFADLGADRLGRRGLVRLGAPIWPAVQAIGRDGGALGQ
jgi:hypothetical protein